MEAQAPSSQTTLLILLGASEWPLSPEFESSKAFANAAKGLKAYFLDSQGFGLPQQNMLDLFNSNESADDLDLQIGQFLDHHLTTVVAVGTAVRDVLVYFIGHGGFIGRNSDYFLAIRRTRMTSLRVSGIQMIALADILTEKARDLRRIIILDCCFAAAAFSAFQAGPAQVAVKKTIDAFEVKVRKKVAGFPVRGTALLCSSDQRSPSLLLPDGSSTMFSKALLDVLVQGDVHQQEFFSLRDVKEMAKDVLSEMRNAPQPVVHSPDQSEGDIADIPFFPNPLIARERAYKAEVERLRRGKMSNSWVGSRKKQLKAEVERLRQELERKDLALNNLIDELERKDLALDNLIDARSFDTITLLLLSNFVSVPLDQQTNKLKEILHELLENAILAKVGGGNVFRASIFLPTEAVLNRLLADAFSVNENARTSQSTSTSLPTTNSNNYDEDDYIRIWAQIGLDSKTVKVAECYIGDRQDVQQGLAGLAFKGTEPLVAHMVEQEGKWICKEYPDVYKRFVEHSIVHYKTLAVMPIVTLGRDRSKRKTVGVVCYDSMNATLFDGEEARRALKTVSSRIGAILSISWQLSHSNQMRQNSQVQS